MTLAAVVAAAMFLGVVIYAVLGGADFGSGVWDLTAGDARRGAHVRALIDHSIGPVWEANHVWLIYILVFLWTAFPQPFAAIMTTVQVPLALGGVGVVLRGSGFAFRKFSGTVGQARLFGAVFAASSVVTPFFLGTVAGAVASGRIPAGGHGDVWSSWTGPTSLIGGSIAVLTCAFLAATFLAADANRAGNVALAEAMGRRALFVGAVAGVVVLASLLPLQHDAPTLAHGLQGKAAVFVAASAVAGLAALALLWMRRWAVARIAAVGAVVGVVLGWGVAQYPWILVDQVKIAAGAGAHPTLVGLMAVFALAAIVVLPSLGYLLWLTQQTEWAGQALESDLTDRQKG